MVMLLIIIPAHLGKYNKSKTAFVCCIYNHNNYNDHSILTKKLLIIECY